jgi:hypothetical protein
MSDLFDYQSSGFAVRESIKQAHRSSWDLIAKPGSFWTGEERVQIAEQARSARLQRSELPFNRNYPHSNLPDGALEVARTIAADAKRINPKWASEQIALIESGPYVEISSIVVTITAIDTFSEALGREHAALPSPQPGQTTGEQNPTVADIGGYVPMMEPWQGPNVARALSLVPAANALFMSNVQQMYASNGGGFSDMVWDGPLSRPQAELLAARVSSVNECFY